MLAFMQHWSKYLRCIGILISLLQEGKKKYLQMLHSRMENLQERKSLDYLKDTNGQARVCLCLTVDIIQKLPEAGGQFCSEREGTSGTHSFALLKQGKRFKLEIGESGAVRFCKLLQHIYFLLHNHSLSFKFLYCAV